MKKSIIIGVIIGVVLGTFMAIHYGFAPIPVIHKYYDGLHKLGLRKPPQVTYLPDGTIHIDRLDPGQTLEFEIKIPITVLDEDEKSI